MYYVFKKKPSFISDYYLFTVKKYLSRDIITKMYPLHEPEDLKKLGADWYQIKRIFKEQPIGV